MRMFDTFLYDGEADLLQHRLDQTYDLIDAFVLVEAHETFRGVPKAAHFRDQRARFAWASDKIRVVSLKRLGSPTESPWNREAFQRNAIALGLRDAAPEDIVFLLDADEILSRALLTRLRQTGIDRPHRLAMTRHYAYLDQIAPGSPCCADKDAPFAFFRGRLRPGTWSDLADRWHGHSGVVARFKDLAGDEQETLPGRSAYELRRFLRHAPVLEGAGRHFNATDPSGRTERKLGRIAHQELAKERALCPIHLKRTRHCGVHHYGWWYAETPEGPLAEDLERLSQACPEARRPAPLPPIAFRRAVRTWFWLRLSPWIADCIVRFVDRHFESLVAVLSLPLAAAELLRFLAARWGWRWLRFMSAKPEDHGHF